MDASPNDWLKRIKYELDEKNEFRKLIWMIDFDGIL